MNSKPRAFLFSVAIYVAFFASGAASLIAEITWNRMLIVVVGNSLSAAALIIGVFMSGLGLGSHFGGRFFAGRKASLRPYVALELGIGIYVALSPLLFAALAAFFTALAGSMADRAWLTAIRLGVTIAALLLPAMAMGATFPAMISGAAPDSPTRRSARTGYLYSVNTLGAAIGCFAAGYHLLFEVGVRTTLIVALALYAFAAVCALLALAARGSPGGSAAADPESPDGHQPLQQPRGPYLAVATFAVGFVSLAYEVLLTRIGILYLGNSVSVFPLVLTGFLLGTGVSAVAGTWLYGRLTRRSSAGERLFGILALGAGVLVLAVPYLLLLEGTFDLDRFARVGDATPRNPLPILGIIMGPTVLIGALLPIAIRMLRSKARAEATRDAARLYALNTAGGVIGAAVANHFLVPLIGIQGVIVTLTLICGVVGAMGLVRPAGGSRPRVVALAVVAALGVLMVVALPDMMMLYADRLAQSTRAERVDVKLVHEGRAATVTVLDQFDPKRGDYRDMYLNGVEEASTRYWHVQLFKLLGILPVLIHESEEPKETMVIAFGAGITAGSVLASDQVGSLDVVDLNPDIEGINDLFTEVNGDVFHEPRFHFHNDDGRNYLVTSGKQYDLIIGDSTHPRAYDSWILYTRDFYEAVRDRLRPGGIFAQWVPVLGSMRGELMRIHLNTFRSVFPHTTFWYIYGSDQAFLLATPEPLSIDPEALQARLDELPEWFQAGHYQIDTVPRVAGFFWMDDAAMARMIGAETRINTDDRHFFDKQSAVFPLPPQYHLPQFQANAVPSFRSADASLTAAIRDEQTVALHLGRFAFYRDSAELGRAFCRMPDNGNARYFMERRFAGEIPDPAIFCGDQDIRDYRALVAIHPDNAIALNGLADALTRAGQLDEALEMAERANTIDPDNGMLLDTWGWILFLQGKNQPALETLEYAARFLPDHPIVLYHLGAASHALGNGRMAREYLEKALATGEFPGADEARALLEQIQGS